MAVTKNWRDTLRPLKRHIAELYFSYQVQPKLRGRHQLPSFLNARGLRGTGVEVGVFEGLFSNFILTHWRGERLISVDPWLTWGEEYQDARNQNQAVMDSSYETTRKVLAPHGSRSEIWRLTSKEAAAKITDNSLDFVYIDAQHHEVAVTEDLHLWYPKVRTGGILAGHDYLDGHYDFGVFGVKTAVDRFAAEYCLTLHVTTELEFPSWFLFKP